MSEVNPSKSTFADGIIKLDPKTQSIYCHDQLVPGTGAIGYGFVDFLVDNIDTVQSQGAIFRNVWQRRSPNYDDLVRNRVLSLRKGFGEIDPRLADPENGAIISVRTPLLIGYCAVSSLTETKWPEKMSRPADHLTSPDGRVDLNTVTGQVKVSGQSVNLSPREFLLLQSLTRHAGQVFSKEDLMQDAWGHTSFEPAVLKTHLSNLRGTIKAVNPLLGNADDGLIRRKRGQGYYLATDIEA